MLAEAAADAGALAPARATSGDGATATADVPSVRAHVRRALRTIYWQWPCVRPRGTVLSTRDWVERTREDLGSYQRRRGPWRDVVHPECVRVARACPAPILPHEDGGFVRHWRQTYIPTWAQVESAVTYIEDGYVFSDDGVVLTSRNEVLNEFSHGWSPNAKLRPPHYRPFATFVGHIDECVEPAAVLSAPGWDSHYHLLLQIVPRLKLLLPYQDHVERLIIPGSLSDRQVEILRLFGASDSKLERVGRGRKKRYQKLFLPTIPGNEGAVPEWVVDFLRDAALGPAAHRVASTPEVRRVYVRRGGRRRRVLNEAQLCRIFERRGWTVLDGDLCDFREQVATLASAKYIVGAHGAALTNMVFAQHARVVEIFAEGHLALNCFDHLAERSGHEYWWMIAGRADSQGDFEVDPAKVERALDRLEAL